MLRSLFILLAFASCAPAAEPAWATAYKKGAMSKEETRAFMKKLAQYVVDHHLKKDANSEQRGMVYEYFDTARLGKADQFVQGEALDTMHDGAWLVAALASAYRATGDQFYKEFLTKWLLPFYCKILNHSDTLFSAKVLHAGPKAPKFDREHLLQEGEKGFVPYWWDDGSSVSLERLRTKERLPAFPAYDRFLGEQKPNPEHRLSGYSLGSSNHLAQDLGVMLMSAWLLLRDGSNEDKKLAAEVAEAAKNLQACRTRHFGHIPMCDAPAALALDDVELLRQIPDQSRPEVANPDNHYWRAFGAYKPGQRYPFPGFADDQQYRYYFGLARHGGTLPDPLAFRIVYDAFTEPMLYRAYSDDAPVPPGINRFDLHPYYAQDGKPLDYRSDRKGPGGGPRPIGSRMGPQNMVCSGYALQILKANPKVWPRPRDAREDRIEIDDPWPDIDLPEILIEVPTLVWEHLVTNIVSDEDKLAIGGTSSDPKLEFEIVCRTQGGAKVEINRDGTFKIVNAASDALQAKCKVEKDGKGFKFNLKVPYARAKGQKPWLNGVEGGLYELRAGGQTMASLRFTSSTQRVRTWLEFELGRGLRTWESIFAEKGFIPTGIGAGAEWDRFSDAGGYAHLIAACAQWLIYLGGKCDWELMKVPTVK